MTTSTSIADVATKISGVTNRGTWTNTPTTATKVTIPKGYHNGSGYVDTSKVYSSRSTTTKQFNFGASITPSTPSVTINVALSGFTLIGAAITKCNGSANVSGEWIWVECTWDSSANTVTINTLAYSGTTCSVNLNYDGSCTAFYVKSYL